MLVRSDLFVMFFRFFRRVVLVEQGIDQVHAAEMDGDGAGIGIKFSPFPEIFHHQLGVGIPGQTEEGVGAFLRQFTAFDGGKTRLDLFRRALDRMCFFLFQTPLEPFQRGDDGEICRCLERIGFGKGGQIDFFQMVESLCQYGFCHIAEISRGVCFCAGAADRNGTGRVAVRYPAQIHFLLQYIKIIFQLEFFALKDGFSRKNDLVLINVSIAGKFDPQRDFILHNDFRDDHIEGAVVGVCCRDIFPHGKHFFPFHNVGIDAPCVAVVHPEFDVQFLHVGGIQFMDRTGWDLHLKLEDPVLFPGGKLDLIDRCGDFGTLVERGDFQFPGAVDAELEVAPVSEVQFFRGNGKFQLVGRLFGFVPDLPSEQKRLSGFIPDDPERDGCVPHSFVSQRIRGKPFSRNASEGDPLPIGKVRIYLDVFHAPDLITGEGAGSQQDRHRQQKLFQHILSFWFSVPLWIHGGVPEPYNSSLLFQQFRQQSVTTGGDILPGCLEVAGVPGIRHFFAGAAGIFQQEMDLSFRVAAADCFHVADIGAVHADEQIKAVVIAPVHLPCCLARAGNAVFRQFPSGSVMDRVPDLFGAGGGRLDLKQRFHARLSNKMFHHELRHGTAADISVAYEQDPVHVFFSFI